jgi:hypothetical protein
MRDGDATSPQWLAVCFPVFCTFMTSATKCLLKVLILHSRLEGQVEHDIGLKGLLLLLFKQYKRCNDNSPFLWCVGRQYRVRDLA